ncbi:hypothetical protein RHGRI_031664 [Rhododendron griersonianum]|uniref:Uncharacterized protein n=2 Tax=Rhododendron griersonianum TaxID=479676 RepID=A0AAV6ICI8_9ERIC|nr:hypothetical protein RHGRI_031664 [Rhododendron griersonianum]
MAAGMKVKEKEVLVVFSEQEKANGSLVTATKFTCISSLEAEIWANYRGLTIFYLNSFVYYVVI